MSKSIGTAYGKMGGMAWRNVVRNWRHSLATILAIASGFTAVSLFDGFMKKLNEINFDGYSTRGMLGHVMIEKAGAQDYFAEDPWKYSLDKADQAFIEDFVRSDPAVKHRVRFIDITGIANANDVNTIFIGHGYDIEEGAKVRGERWEWNTVAGKPLHIARESAVVVGRSLGRLLGCEEERKTDDFFLPDGNYVPEDRPFKCKQPRLSLSATTEMAQINALDLPIAGFIDAAFREADKRALSMSIEDAQRLLDTDKISMVSVQLHDEKQLSAFVERFRAAASGKGLHLDILPWSEHKLAAYVRGGMELLGVFRNLFMFIVVTIGVMSVANTMMKSVNERIREIGTLRSLGFLRRDLQYIFACEGFFLSLIACVLGLALTIVVGTAIGMIGITFKAGVLSVPIHLSVGYAPFAWLFSTVMLSVLATSTAWFCARRASKMVIADAMRHV